MDENLQNERTVAARLGIAPATLRKWRCTGAFDLPFVKLGHTVRYRMADVERFIAERTRRPGQQ